MERDASNTHRCGRNIVAKQLSLMRRPDALKYQKARQVGRFIPMNDAALVYPMLAMVALTAYVLGTLFQRRTRAVKNGQLSSRFFRVYQGELEPDEVAKATRHFANLFEAPVLFYVACVTAIATRQVTVLAVLLAWAYVALRVAHAYIHLGDNRLRQRIPVYFASWCVLLALWITIAFALAW